MTCDELLERLTDYKESVLPAELCRELEEHLRDCHDCSALERDLEDLRRLCRDCPTPRLPETLRRRMEALLGRR